MQLVRWTRWTRPWPKSTPRALPVLFRTVSPDGFQPEHVEPGNLSASRSSHSDADFAAETANLSRAQILQQAGTAMLAQANSLSPKVF